MAIAFTPPPPSQNSNQHSRSTLTCNSHFTSGNRTWAIQQTARSLSRSLSLLCSGVRAASSPWISPSDLQASFQRPTAGFAANQPHVHGPKGNSPIGLARAWQLDTELSQGVSVSKAESAAEKLCGRSSNPTPEPETKPFEPKC